MSEKHSQKSDKTSEGQPPSRVMETHLRAGTE